MLILILLCAIGFLVSVYGFFIEQQLKKNPSYKPACDISDNMSCTKPLQSSFSKLFGISNTIIGMVFYAVMGVLAWWGYYLLVFLGSAAACLVSLYLAYVLYAKIKTLCLICTITYLVNGALLLASVWYIK